MLVSMDFMVVTVTPRLKNWSGFISLKLRRTYYAVLCYKNLLFAAYWKPAIKKKPYSMSVSTCHIIRSLTLIVTVLIPFLWNIAYKCIFRMEQFVKTLKFQNISLWLTYMHLKYLTYKATKLKDLHIFREINYKIVFWWLYIQIFLLYLLCIKHWTTKQQWNSIQSKK